MTEKVTPPGFWAHIRPRTVHEKALRLRATFCLGGLSFLAFLILLGTGLILVFHYQPGEEAFNSIVEIQSFFPYGALIRGLHFWAAQLMVWSVFLHMIRVIWHRAYRHPRELNWLVGVGLLVTTLVLDFTGYLLRGNQESGAAATVGQTLLHLLPGGEGMATVFLGTVTAVNGSSLAVYAWHCFLLPGASIFFMTWHFWRVRKDGRVRPL